VGEGLTFQQKELDKVLENIGRPKEKRVPIDSKYKRRSVIVISGPTCSGKTDLSLVLAQSLGGEIISADSMQVYRGMDIGTAKVTAEQQELVMHHLVDIRDVNDPITVSDFFVEAHKACESITARNRIPIVVGGSGFYLRAFLHGIPSGPPSVPEVRKEFEHEAETLGVEVLYDWLQLQDPEYAATITNRDKQKIVRALEIIALTGEKVSAFVWKYRPLLPDYNFHCWFIHRPRSSLYSRVEERCDRMLEDGLLDEIEALEKTGMLKNPSACQAIGYRQGIEFLKTDRSPEQYEEFVRVFKKASRHYVKRQFTWFRKDPVFTWLDVDLHDIETASDIIMQDYMSW